jgi:hypothetical protein
MPCRVNEALAVSRKRRRLICFAVQQKEPTIIARRGTFLLFGRAVEWLQSVVFANDYTLLTGRGPGKVQEQFHYLSHNAFDTTWGKIVYEYGLVGSLIYALSFYVAKGAKGLRFAMATLSFARWLSAQSGHSYAGCGDGRMVRAGASRGESAAIRKRQRIISSPANSGARVSGSSRSHFFLRFAWNKRRTRAFIRMLADGGTRPR